MDIKSLEEIQSNEIVRKRLAKILVHDTLRNSKLEDFHNRLSQDEMKALMIDFVNRAYKFLNRLSGTEGDHMVSVMKKQDFDAVAKWNDPE